MDSTSGLYRCFESALDPELLLWSRNLPDRCHSPRLCLLDQPAPHPSLQFRRKRAGRPAGGGGGGAGVAIGERGVLHQAAGFGQCPATGFALQAQRQFHVLQEREEAETLLAIDDHSVTIRKQPAACRPGAAVQALGGPDAADGAAIGCR